MPFVESLPANVVGHVVVDALPAAGAGLTAEQLSAATLTTEGVEEEATAIEITVSASGNNTVVTPTSGKRLCVHYMAYNPSAAVEAVFTFVASGKSFLRNTLTVGGSVIAKDFGERRFWGGAIDEPLTLNLSAAVPTNCNVAYDEI